MADFGDLLPQTQFLRREVFGSTAANRRLLLSAVIGQQAVTGHASTRVVERYTKAAEQEKLARSASARLAESN